MELNLDVLWNKVGHKHGNAHAEIGIVTILELESGTTSDAFTLRVVFLVLGLIRT
jgi:hypothetical protein